MDDSSDRKVSFEVTAYRVWTFLGSSEIWRDEVSLLIIRHTEKGRTRRWKQCHGGDNVTKRDRAVAQSLLIALENKRYSKTLADKARKEPSFALRTDSASVPAAALYQIILRPLPASVWYFIKVINSRDKTHHSKHLKTHSIFVLPLTTSFFNTTTQR